MLQFRHNNVKVDIFISPVAGSLVTALINDNNVTYSDLAGKRHAVSIKQQYTLTNNCGYALLYCSSGPFYANNSSNGLAILLPTFRNIYLPILLNKG